MNRSVRSSRLPRATLVAGLLAALFAGSAAVAAPARARAGAACTAAQEGTRVDAPPPALLCSRMVLRSSRRTVWRWLPLAAGETRPSAATVARYGGVAAPAPTTPAPAGAAPTTSAGSTPATAGAAPGGRCVEGVWTLSAPDLNAYLEQASGVPGNFEDGSRLTITLRNGTFTGSGQLKAGDPTGVVSGSARPVNAGRYIDDGTTLSFPDTATIVVIELMVAGNPVNPPSFAATGGLSVRYTCTAATLSYTNDIPGGRRATVVWRRA